MSSGAGATRKRQRVQANAPRNESRSRFAASSDEESGGEDDGRELTAMASKHDAEEQPECRSWQQSGPSLTGSERLRRPRRLSSGATRDDQDESDNENEQRKSAKDHEESDAQHRLASSSAISSFFDRETTKEEAKRRRKALRATEEKLSHVQQWKQLELPSFADAQAIVRDLQSKSSVASRTAKLLSARGASFPLDFYLLQHDFNLLFFGLGSKKQLLELFATAIRRFELNMKRPPSCALVINGYSSVASSNFTETLGKLVTDYLGQPDANVRGYRTVERLAEFIAEKVTLAIQRRAIKDSNAAKFAGSGLPRSAPVWERDLLILVHNIDGESIRSRAVQNALATLAASRGIRLVASVDHVHSPLLWDHVQSAKFNFCFRQATTLQPYLIESSDKPEQFALKHSSAAGAKFVLRSLTNNHKEVLQVLARHQLDKNRLGMTQNELYEACSQDMVVSSRAALMRLLVEFKDHKIVASRRPANRQETLYIAWEPKVIRSVLLGESS